jgi:hypothetical protein
MGCFRYCRSECYEKNKKQKTTTKRSDFALTVNEVSPTSRSANTNLYRMGLENTQNALLRLKSISVMGSLPMTMVSAAGRSEFVCHERSVSTGWLYCYGSRIGTTCLPDICLVTRPKAHVVSTYAVNERANQQRRWSFFLTRMTRQTQTNALSRLWGFFPFFHRTQIIKCSAQWTIQAPNKTIKTVTINPLIVGVPTIQNFQGLFPVILRYRVTHCDC